MILLDTHIWIWWVSESKDLSAEFQQLVRSQQEDGLGVSIISCWEAAKLVERGKLNLTLPIEEWLSEALYYPGIQLLELTPKIAIESTQLPGTFHRDPADQLIVATARIHDFALVTADTKIRNYPYVRLADSDDSDSDK